MFLKKQVSETDQFPKRCFLRNIRWWTKSKNMILSNELNWLRTESNCSCQHSNKSFDYIMRNSLITTMVNQKVLPHILIFPKNKRKKLAEIWCPIILKLSTLDNKDSLNSGQWHGCNQFLKLRLTVKWVGLCHPIHQIWFHQTSICLVQWIHVRKFRDEDMVIEVKVWLRHMPENFFQQGI
jgi:hypothetical protein